MAGQMAKRRGLLQGPMAKKLARLDTAAHYVRHCTRQKMQQFVDQLEAALATKPAMDEEETKEKVDTNEACDQKLVDKPAAMVPSVDDEQLVAEQSANGLGYVGVSSAMWAPDDGNAAGESGAQDIESDSVPTNTLMHETDITETPGTTTRSAQPSLSLRLHARYVELRAAGAGQEAPDDGWSSSDLADYDEVKSLLGQEACEQLQTLRQQQEVRRAGRLLATLKARQARAKLSPGG